MSTTRNVVACLSLLFLNNVLSVSGRERLPGLKIDSLFAFGDSFLDNGNVFTLTGDPGYPYGITYPKYPTGRYSDGANLLDTFSKYLGLWPPPPPFFGVNFSLPIPKNGLNFAIGGSGAVKSITGPWQDLVKQVDFFKLVADAKIYNLSTALILTSVGGNDYEALRNGELLTEPRMKKLAPIVINGTWVQIKRLYDLGARNFAILNLQPTECQPMYVEGGGNPNKCLSTKLTNYAIHNKLLKQVEVKLEKLKAKVVILDLYKASLKILDNPKCFGLTKKTRYSACCSGPPGNLMTCGQYNVTTKKPLFTVCKSPKSLFWWDTDHFTQSAVQALSGLFFYSKGYSSKGKNFCTGLGIPCRKYNPKAKGPADVPFNTYCVSKK